MISNGLKSEGFMSEQITEEDITDNTLILTMSEESRQKIFELFPNVEKEDVAVLTEFVGDELEILNPYGGNLQAYGICYETLNKSIKKLVKILNEGEEKCQKYLLWITRSFSIKSDGYEEQIPVQRISEH